MTWAFIGKNSIREAGKQTRKDEHMQIHSSHVIKWRKNRSIMLLGTTDCLASGRTINKCIYHW